MIRVNEITKAFEAHTIFKALSFEIRAQEIFTILGPSGVGKSTLLNILAKLDYNFTGTIKYNPKVYEHIKVPFPIVFQESIQLFPWLTASENIMIGGKNLDLFKEVCVDLELESSLMLYPNQLSGGLKQRVAIARALMCESKILFMDEPFSNLDFSIRKKLQDLLITLRVHYNKTIVFITHDIDEALYISNRMLILRKEDFEIIEDLTELNRKEIENKVCL